MSAAVARIFLRYVIGSLLGALVALGILAPEVVQQIIGDQDVEFVLTMAVPVVSGAIVEVWYWAAKRYGWVT